MDTICAFANTNGGVMYIGKDDSGKVKGVENSKVLLTDIPSKISNILGFSPDVRLKNEKRKEYIEIKVKPQLTGIALRGKFYLRSGSSTVELKGPQLQKFLLEKSGQNWESVVETKASLNDIDQATIDKFRELAKTRFPAAAKEKSVKNLLEKLHLLENGKLTRAAILLFGKDPQKFFKSATIKIGTFLSDTELKNTDVIEGNLFEQVESVLSLLKNKYLKYNARIEGLYRKEELEYPEEALREAIINSVIHKDYLGSHTQMRLEPDKLILWNYGELPAELSLDRLRKKHRSLPRNPKIADVFYKAGLIEAWGRGTTKMIEELTKAGLPEPLYENEDGGFSITFLQDSFTEELLLKKGLNARQISGVLHLKKTGKITNQVYQQITNASKRTATRDLAILVDYKIVEQTGKTGKGTEYNLRGHKGAKGDNSVTEETKGATKGSKGPLITVKDKTELDKKLDELENELEMLGDDKVIETFEKELFFEMYNGWLGQVVKEFVSVVQRFNKYFTKPRHTLMMNSSGWVSFINESPNSIIKNHKEACLKNSVNIQPNHAKLDINTSYGSLIKGGLDTFGCNYSIQIRFLDNWYEIYMTEKPGENKQILQYKRLYHQQITKTEAEALALKFGDLIYEHIKAGIARIKNKNKE